MNHPLTNCRYNGNTIFNQFSVVVVVVLVLLLLLLVTINTDLKYKGWRYKSHVDFHTSICEWRAQGNRTLSEGSSTAFRAFHIVRTLRAKGDSLKTWKHTLIEAFYSFGIGFRKAFPKDRCMNLA